MITQDKLKAEIDLMLHAMATTDQAQRDYSIGALTMLLWIESGGEMSRGQAFQQAVAAWEAAKGSLQKQ